MVLAMASSTHRQHSALQGVSQEGRMKLDTRILLHRVFVRSECAVANPVKGKIELEKREINRRE